MSSSLSEARILDTSPTAPRRSFFLEEARDQFVSTQYKLSSMDDLERYWFDLQSVCLKTDIRLNSSKLVTREM